MLGKGLSNKIQKEREAELLPLLRNLLTLIPSDRDEDVTAVVAAMTRVSDNYAQTKAHFVWTQMMMDFAEKYPQHETVVRDIFQYINDAATVELIIAGVSQEDLNRLESNVKALMNVD